MTKDQAFVYKTKPSEVSVSSGSKFVGAVFLYTFIALAISAVVCGVCGFLLKQFIFGTSGSEEAMDIFLPVFFVSLILYIPTLIWVQIAAIRNGKSMGFAFVLYSIIMGVLLSTFTAFIDFYTIAVSFGITCLAFGIMALIAWGSKRNISTLAVIASGLISGALIIWLFYWIFSLLTLSAFSSIYVEMLISYAIFIAIILITIVDLNRVKVIAETDGAGKNVALLCAFNLYVDFIYIFIRVIALVSRFKRN